jgi:hypothetical protein
MDPPCCWTRWYFLKQANQATAATCWAEKKLIQLNGEI